MSPKTPARREQPATPGDHLIDLLARMRPEIEKAIPSAVSGDRLARLATTAIRLQPKLGECTPASFLGALLSAATLGLDVNTPQGHAYLIPFNRCVNRNGQKEWFVECQLIVGYRGMMELARRSGAVSFIRAVVVRQGDDFRVIEGARPDLQHLPSTADDRTTAPVTHVYAIARLRSGETIFEWLTRRKVEEHRARSKAKDSGPWITDWEAMAKKTAVRCLFPWIPASADDHTPRVYSSADERVFAAADDRAQRILSTAVALDEAADRGAQASSYPPGVIDVIDRAGLDLPPTDVGSPEPDDPNAAFLDLIDGP